MAGKKILKEGLLRKIGDGLSIKICDPSWIPGYYGSEVHLLDHSLNENAGVSDLMSEDASS